MNGRRSVAALIGLWLAAACSDESMTSVIAPGDGSAGAASGGRGGGSSDASPVPGRDATSGSTVDGRAQTGGRGGASGAGGMNGGARDASEDSLLADGAIVRIPDASVDARSAWDGDSDAAEDAGRDGSTDGEAGGPGAGCSTDADCAAPGLHCGFLVLDGWKRGKARSRVGKGANEVEKWQQRWTDYFHPEPKIVVKVSETKRAGALRASGSSGSRRRVRGRARVTSREAGRGRSR